MLRYLTAGESHGQALTAIVEGFPLGRDARHRDRSTASSSGGKGDTAGGSGRSWRPTV